MQINFENLEKINDILIKLESLESKICNSKRWMSTNELAEYLGYSKDSIDSLVESGELKKDTHYYQKKRKRLFDKFKIDLWVTESNTSVDLIVNEIISSISS